jgi:hypothetical protein
MSRLQMSGSSQAVKGPVRAWLAWPVAWGLGWRWRLVAGRVG